MKRTILSFLLIGSAAAVMAQQPATNSNSNLNTNRNNNTNNSSLNNNQNTTSPSSLNNSVSPTTNNPVSTMNAGRDTSSNTSPSYNNSTTTLNEPMSSSDQTNAPLRTTATYNVEVPASIQKSFTTTYPSVSGNRWMQSGDWYVTRYLENGVISQVSYREDGKTLTSTVAPIRKSYVPDELISQAIQKYGANVYAVGSVKGANGQDMYTVTVIENGQAKTEWINQDGTPADNHFRTEDNRQ